MVCCVGRKEAARPDRTPNCARIEVRARERAREPVCSLRCAHAADVGERPIEDTDLCECRDANGHDLDGEELARRDLDMGQHLHACRIMSGCLTPQYRPSFKSCEKFRALMPEM